MTEAGRGRLNEKMMETRKLVYGVRLMVWQRKGMYLVVASEYMK